MLAGKPSLTAAFVAFGRGVGLERSSSDPTAATLLGRGVGDVVRAANGRLGPLVRAAARAGSLGLVDHVCLRTLAIDRALLDWLGDGRAQVVILGAGLDGRAWRLSTLDQAVVYEVDHPSTQRGKRKRIAGLTPCARSVEFVGVDFEREAVGARLEEAGHDPEQPTFWIWEGVTMYLPREAAKATLEDVADRSAAASRLAVTYAVPTVTALGLPALGSVARSAFSVLGEPLVGLMTSSEAEQLLASVGYQLMSDEDSGAWSRGQHASTLAAAFRAERLAVADRR